MSRPHVCPVCTGQGIVSRPPWVAGDQPTWTASSVDTYECHVCNGTGIIWEPTTPPEGEAVTLLGRARDAVADYVDSLPAPSPLTPEAE